MRKFVLCYLSLTPILFAVLYGYTSIAGAGWTSVNHVYVHAGDSGTLPGAPTQPTLHLPPDGAELDDNTPTFEWTPGENAENHRLLVDNDLDFTSPEENVLLGGTDNTYTVADENSLPDDNYFWKVVAIKGADENSSGVWRFVVSTVVEMQISLAAFAVVSAGAAVLSIAMGSFMHYKRRWDWSRAALIFSPAVAVVVVAAYLLLIF